MPKLAFAWRYLENSSVFLQFRTYWYWQQSGGATILKYALPRNSPPEKRAIDAETWEVVNISDGDTITIERGGEEKKVRLCGIDAPEVKHGKAPGQPLGKEAREKLRALLLKKEAKVPSRVLFTRFSEKRSLRQVGKGVSK